MAYRDQDDHYQNQPSRPQVGDYGSNNEWERNETRGGYDDNQQGFARPSAQHGGGYESGQHGSGRFDAQRREPSGGWNRQGGRGYDAAGSGHGAGPASGQYGMQRGSTGGPDQGRSYPQRQGMDSGSYGWGGYGPNADRYGYRNQDRSGGQFMGDQQGYRGYGLQGGRSQASYGGYGRYGDDGDGAGNWGASPGVGESARHDQRGGWGQGGRERHFDPDYHQWREEQIRNLDTDYDDWRRERYGKFSDEFTTWRAGRQRKDTNPQGGNAVNKDTTAKTPK